MSRKKSGIWSFFSSVQLAIVLLSLIAFFALVGTLVPQREAAVEMAARVSPGLFSFLQKIQIFDLYHSVWFFLLMGLLAVNLAVCSLDRFPLAWRRFRMRPSPASQEIWKDISPADRFQAKAGLQEAAAAAERLLKKKYRTSMREDGTESIFLCARRGRFSLFGVYIVHLSILILIAGALIGSVFGVEAFVNITEGETADAVFIRGGERMMLPFSVRCDKFTLELYDNGAPKTFQSDLTFLKDGKELHTEKLLVNHPVEFEGFRFYQSSYGAAPGGKATLELSRPGGKSDVVNVAAGYTFDLPGKEGTFEILKVEQNLMNMGPAVKVLVRSRGREETIFVFHHIDQIRQMNPGIIDQVPMFNPGLVRPYTFVLMGLEEKNYTGLQVSKDPGTPVVAFAAVLLVGGLMLILLSYARFVWVRVQLKGEGVDVSVAGRSYKNKVGLEKELQYLLAELKDDLERPA